MSAETFVSVLGIAVVIFVLGLIYATLLDIRDALRERKSS